MLKSLLIKNYALIDRLEILFNEGFTIITGETGAGKSIILGALSLILGKRADKNVLLDKENKCIVEGKVNISKYNLSSFFSENDLDFDDNTIIRREINAAGKSRAFINDTPVNLALLREFSLKLIDIHSQHQNLDVLSSKYQIRTYDQLADCIDVFSEFRLNYIKLKELKKELEELKSIAAKEKADMDYYNYQFNQLDEAQLIDNEQDDLVQEQTLLSHAEEIKSNLSEAQFLLGGEMNDNVLDLIRKAKTNLEQISSFYSPSDELTNRLESAYIELKDLSEELDYKAGSIELDENRLDFINERLNLIYTLQQKHQVNSVDELIKIREDLDEKINKVVSYDDKIEKLEDEFKKQYSLADKTAKKLSGKRKSAGKKIMQSISETLAGLGMPSAIFDVKFQESQELTENGWDSIEFIFSANKNIPVASIAKVASGGELSRLLLSLKYQLSKSVALPTIILDEIDTGVSGDIADKMGKLMKEMAEEMQVISITHLPQIAARGKDHFKVVKEEKDKSTVTSIVKLDEEQRKNEIAKMLSGEKLSNAALENAIALLSN
jgi:DNA repair protein RecN (Recombination protein N)